jgi:hypothetical protein
MALVAKVLGNVLRAGEGEKSIHKAPPEYFWVFWKYLTWHIIVSLLARQGEVRSTQNISGHFSCSYGLLLLPKCTRFHFEIEFEVLCILTFLFSVHICLLHSTIRG